MNFVIFFSIIIYFWVWRQLKRKRKNTNEFFSRNNHGSAEVTPQKLDVIFKILFPQRFILVHTEMNNNCSRNKICSGRPAVFFRSSVFHMALKKKSATELPLFHSYWKKNSSFGDSKAFTVSWPVSRMLFCFSFKFQMKQPTHTVSRIKFVWIFLLLRVDRTPYCACVLVLCFCPQKHKCVACKLSILKSTMQVCIYRLRAKIILISIIWWTKQNKKLWLFPPDPVHQRCWCCDVVVKWCNVVMESIQNDFCGVFSVWSD